MRRSGFDELGLRRALADRMLPLLVAAMAFLAALALAGWFGSAALVRHWREGAGSALTVQVPNAGATVTAVSNTSPPARLAAVLAVLGQTPGIAAVHALSDRELNDLLRPWIGTETSAGGQRLAIPVPAVVAIRLADPNFDMAPLARRLEAAAPGTLIEDHGAWILRLTRLARSLQACAGVALLLVAAVAAAVIAVATRAGLSTRREAIEIVHGLGAPDSLIAGRFAARVTTLAGTGAAVGGLVALPVLLALAGLAEPFSGQTAAIAAGQGLQDATTPDVATLGAALAALPQGLWLSLPCLPVVAALIGFLTAQTTVRRWLRRLP